MLPSGFQLYIFVQDINAHVLATLSSVAGDDKGIELLLSSILTEERVQSECLGFLVVKYFSFTLFTLFISSLVEKGDTQRLFTGRELVAVKSLVKKPRGYVRNYSL